MFSSGLFNAGDRISGPASHVQYIICAFSHCWEMFSHQGQWFYENFSIFLYYLNIFLYYLKILQRLHMASIRVHVFVPYRRTLKALHLKIDIVITTCGWDIFLFARMNRLLWIVVVIFLESGSYCESNIIHFVLLTFNDSPA